MASAERDVDMGGEHPRVIGTFERAEIQLEADEAAKDKVLDKIDALIARRRLMDKPYDQLEEIREEVENL